MIPEQYNNPDFRFCLIKFSRTGSKKPYGVNFDPWGREWNKPENIISVDRIPDYLKRGYGFGILPGYGSLLIIDIDKKSETEKIHSMFQEAYPTFSVKTASDKYHLYYYCEERYQDITSWKEFKGYNERPDGTKAKIAPAIVEVFSKPTAKQVLTCINNTYEGKSYSIMNDFPITWINRNQIERILKPYTGLGEDPDKPIEVYQHKKNNIGFEDRKPNEIDYCIDIFELVDFNDVINHYGISSKTFVCPECSNWSSSKGKHHNATTQHPDNITCMRCSRHGVFGI